MATTTNYGWTTPDNTALVKDGASAIRTLGSSVDTSLKSLSPGTTAGDVDYYTSSTAKARLAIGTSGQVLTVSGGVPSWATSSAGSLTLLSTTTLSGTSTTISSISGSYTHLYVQIYGVSASSGNSRMEVAPNGDTTLCTTIGTNSGNTTASNYLGNYLVLTGGIDTTPANTENFFEFTIHNYAQATRKQIIGGGAFVNTSSQGSASGIQAAYFSTSAITSLVIRREGTTFTAGTVKIYGVN
jgi:hypothetical protein